MIIKIYVKHSLDPEYWEAELFNIPKKITDANPGNLHIYGTSQDSEKEAVDDLISELKELGLEGTVKIIR